MGRKLYVGNLPYSATEETLRETFSKCGDVDSATMITDRDTGQSKGFGFVEMSRDSEAQKAIQELNGSTLDGREIKVNEAKPKAPRRGGGAFGLARPLLWPGRRAASAARRGTKTLTRAIVFILYCHS